MRLRLPSSAAARAALFSVMLSAVLMAAKITVGIVSGSAAVLSDGIDSLEDLITASIVLASLRYGARPPDAEHPYGHGRAETIAATLQAVFIGAGGVFIVYTAVGRFAAPPEEIGTSLAIGVMLVAAAANFALVQYTGRVARQTNSPAIASETRHLWTNVVQALGVVTALVLVAATGEVIFDTAVALGLGAYLLWTAGKILWASVADVLDVSLSEEELALIEQAIEAEGDRIDSFHLLRTRRSGQVRHIDFHLVVPGELTVSEAHDLVDLIEDRIEHLWPGSVVTVHTEPRGVECPAMAGL